MVGLFVGNYYALSCLGQVCYRPGVRWLNVSDHLNGHTHHMRRFFVRLLSRLGRLIIAREKAKRDAGAKDIIDKVGR